MHDKKKNVIAITILVMTLLSAAVYNSISVEAAENTDGAGTEKRRKRIFPDKLFLSGNLLLHRQPDCRGG